MNLRTSFFLLCLGFSISISAQVSTDKIQEKILTSFQDFDLQQGDVSNVMITDNYSSMGIDHVYFKQQINGIEIFDSYGAIHGNANKYRLDGKQLISGLDNYSVTDGAKSSVSELLLTIANVKGYATSFTLEVEKQAEGLNEKSTFLADELSDSPINTRLVYYIAAKAEFRLGVILNIDDPASPDHIEFLVDAETGKIIWEHNYTVYCNFDTPEHSSGSCSHGQKGGFKEVQSQLLGESPLKKDYKKKKSAGSHVAVAANQYKVYDYPLESPLNGSQSVVTSPWLNHTGAASPNGWHNYNSTDFTYTRGNNVDSYLDNDTSNGPTGGDAARASGGATLEFLYDIDTTTTPAVNQEGAIVNLFYWNNLIHDMWFYYGFDEASGNFQEENYTAQGNASDYVRAEAQDGSGTCNANMSTQADGSNPRMQMYLCGGRDGDLDNAVVVHEYTHGISNRLTGGPGAAGCLSNQEQMGEGWSDYFGIVMTIEPGDTATDARPMGNYLFGNGINGGGIRTWPYSVDRAINPFTYDDIKGVSAPHGVGSVWATMLWDLTWALVEIHPLDHDFYNGVGGNNIAMRLVVEGMKQQPCSPGFVDGRDGILAADSLLYGGAYQCLIWEVFAARGLGYSADQGSTGSKDDGTEAFDLPPICSVSLVKTADKTTVFQGDNIVYTFTATNNTAQAKNGLVIYDKLPAYTTFVTGSDNAYTSNDTVFFPPFNLGTGGSKTVTIELMVGIAAPVDLPDFIDNMEGSTAAWTVVNAGSTNFSISTNDSNSGVQSWFSPDNGSPGIAEIITSDLQHLTATSILTFAHNYDTELAWDGGLVLISTDFGETWEDLGPNMTVNGYNSLIYNSIPGFSGNSSGFINTTIDLSSYAGTVAIIKFQMNCDQTVSGVGWYVDDVKITDQELLIPNVATMDNAGSLVDALLAVPTKVFESNGPCFDNLVEIEVKFDDSPEDISLIVRDNQGTIVFTGGPYTSEADGATINEFVCMSDQCYTVEIDDSFGDGLCNNIGGYYLVKEVSSGDTLLYGCDIGAGVVHDLCFPLLSHSVAKLEPSCTGLLDGSIDVTIFGGNPTVTYAYSNGPTSQDQSNIGAGNYYLTINDGVSTILDTIRIYGSVASVYLDAGNINGSLEYAVLNACLVDTIRLEEVLLNEIIVTDNTIVVQAGQVIKGLGMNLSGVSGNGTHQIFNIQSGSSVTLMDMTLQDGFASTNGGALFNNGLLTLRDMKFVNNLEGSIKKSLTTSSKLIVDGEVIFQE